MTQSTKIDEREVFLLLRGWTYKKLWEGDILTWQYDSGMWFTTDQAWKMETLHGSKI
jgi:hypothetical protein